MHRNIGLDVLRGIAIVQVLVLHFLLVHLDDYVPLIGRAMSLSFSGVDLFFVLSGFLIGRIVLDRGEATNFFQVFYIRRALRLLPLYGLAVVLLILTKPAAFSPMYLFFGQNIVWAAKENQPFFALGPTWSLALEEQFYLLLPLLIRVVPPRRLPAVFLALIVAAPLFRIACFTTGHPGAAYMLLPARMDALFIGVLLGWSHQSGRGVQATALARRAIVPMGIAFATLAMFKLYQLGPVLQTVGYTTIDLFYGCVVALVAAKPVLRAWYWRPLAWTGLGAYSIYLFQFFAVAAAFRLFGHHPSALAALAVMLAATGFLCWKLVEAPAIRFGHRRFRYCEAGRPVSSEHSAEPDYAAEPLPPHLGSDLDQDGHRDRADGPAGEERRADA